MKIYLYLLLGLLLLGGMSYGLRLYWSANGGLYHDNPRYIIDADTANEVDDLFAILGALERQARKGPKLIAVTGAQFHTSPLASEYSAEESHAINEQLVYGMGRKDVRVLAGSNEPLATKDRPRDSPAARYIVESALKESPSRKLEVFILGSCTNVASAILANPAIIANLHVRYLGFWYDPATGVYDKKEFNTGNDTLALNLLLNNPGLEFTVMTATTSLALQMNREDLDTRLPQDSPITKILKERWDTYERWWTGEDPGKLRWTIWDVASVEAYFEPELATLESRAAPPGNLARNINVYTAIDSSAMLDNYFRVLSKALIGLEEE